MKTLLVIAAGGALGAMGRYLLTQALPGQGFPWGVLTVNILGAFLVGAVAQFLQGGGAAAQLLRMALVVGLLGGFTTFSSFALDVVALNARGQTAAAGLYILLSVGGALAALMLGGLLAQRLGAA